MMRLATIVFLFAIGDGHRIAQEHEVTATQGTRKFFESCDDLQSIFRRRVVGVQEIVDAHPTATGMNAMNRARFSMRSIGAIRTLRRAEHCPWAAEGDSEDVERAQSIVRTTLAGNPCAAAAMAELTPEAFESAEHEIIPVQRAMLVLVSDDCTVPEVELIQHEAEEQRQTRERETEEKVQDLIDELNEDAAMEIETGSAGSLMETAGAVQRLFKWVGAIFFAIAFGIACAVPMFWVGLIAGWFLGAFYCSVSRCGPGSQEILGFMGFGVVVSVPIGFASCASMPLLAAGRRGVAVQ